MCNAYHIHGAGVSEKRYCVVPPDIREEYRKEAEIADDKFVILCVGELLPNKNQMMIIQAVQQLVPKYPNLLLLIAGNGPQGQVLSAYITEHNLANNVALLGYCTTLEKYQAIANIGVSCSIREGLGFNMIEAMLSGNPVIATKNRGHNELIRDGENGYLVDVDAVDELSERIKTLMESPELRHKMSENGLLISKEYTHTNVKKELEEIYDFNEM